MPHLEEGTIHAWLDGALAPDESQRIEAHVANCETCAAMVAEARGLIAASSRILSALDDVPAGVLPGRDGDADALGALRARKAAERAPRRRRWWVDPRFAAAAGITFIAATATLVVRQGGAPVLKDSAVASERVAEQVPSVVPAPIPAPAAAPAVPARSKNEESSRVIAPQTREVDAASGTSAKLSVAPSVGASAEARDVVTRDSLAPVEAKSLERAAGTETSVRTDQPVERLRAAVPLTAPPAAPSAAPSVAQLRGFAAASARQENLSALADQAPSAALALPRDLAPFCYQLSPATPSAQRQAGIPERIFLDTAVVRMEDGTTWFRARDLSGVQPVRAMAWHSVGNAVIALRVGLPPAVAAPAEPMTELRVLASLAGPAPEGRAVAPPAAPWVAVRVSCPR